METVRQLCAVLLLLGALMIATSHGQRKSPSSKKLTQLKTGSYLFSDKNDVTYEEARAQCEAEGLNLAVIGSEEEALAVLAAGTKKGHGQAPQYWIDKTNLTPDSILWGTYGNNPAMEQGDCVQVQHSSSATFKFDSMDCKKKAQFVCEAPASE